MKTLTQQELKQGTRFFFSNENFEMKKAELLGGEPDIRTAEVLFEEDNRNQWRTGFKIWFNHELIHSTKTFKPLQNRLNKLIKKWNLEPVEDE